MSQMFRVEFKRVGQYRNRSRLIEAASVKHLEEPLREQIDQFLPDGRNYTVTFEELTMKGEIDGGLLGEFTVTPL